MPNIVALKPYEGRVTLPFIKVLAAFLESDSKTMYGSDISAATKLPSGVIYPLLGRLTANGWLEAKYEKKENAGMGRAPSRIYKLTPGGHNESIKLLSENLSASMVDHFAEYNGS